MISLKCHQILEGSLGSNKGVSWLMVEMIWLIHLRLRAIGKVLEVERLYWLVNECVIPVFVEMEFAIWQAVLVVFLILLILPSTTELCWHAISVSFIQKVRKLAWEIFDDFVHVSRNLGLNNKFII